MTQVNRIKCYWDESTSGPCWSWQAWRDEEVVHKGSADSDDFRTAQDLVQCLAWELNGYHVEPGTITRGFGPASAAHITEDGGWAEWSETERITRIKAYWDERTQPTGWSVEVWAGDALLETGGEEACEYNDARELVVQVALGYDVELQDNDVAYHPTEDGGWAEWNRVN